MPIKILARDLVLLLFIFELWKTAHHLTAVSSSFAIPVSILAGMAIAIGGYLVHEWGHLLGALASRSVVQLPDSVFAGFLFKFNSVENTRGQFLGMSCGGFAASALVIAFLFSTLGFDTLADQTALGLTVLGVLAIVVLEFPAAWRVFRGGNIPTGVAYSGSAAAGNGRRR